MSKNDVLKAIREAELEAKKILEEANKKASSIVSAARSDASEMVAKGRVKAEAGDKEAASKALGTGIACGVSFHDFTVKNDERGKPLLSLSGKANELAQAMGVNHVHLTIADERHYAVATVILER